MEPLNINMQIRTAEGFSGHSDRRELHELRAEPQADAEEGLHDARGGAEVRGPREVDGMKFHLEARAPMNLDSIRFK